MPCVGQELYDTKYAFSHILDFCSQLESVIIIPKKTKSFYMTKSRSQSNRSEYVDSASESSESTDNFEWNRILNEKIGSSNITPNMLKFETSVFKALKSLSIYAVPMENIYNTGNLRETLEHLAVNNTTCSQIKDILLCDNIHRGSQELLGKQVSFHYFPFF